MEGGNVYLPYLSKRHGIDHTVTLQRCKLTVGHSKPCNRLPSRLLFITKDLYNIKCH